jgi:hypothetical protein
MTLIATPAATTITARIAPGITITVGVGFCGVRPILSPRSAVRNIGPSRATIAAGCRRAPTPARTSAPQQPTAQDQNRRNDCISHSRPFPLLPKGPTTEPRK